MPPELDAHGRRMLRLRNELDDEGIWLPDDDDLLALLLAELDYARHPHAHEGVAPRYGALLATPDAMRRQPAGSLEIVDISDIPLAVARRLADGRSSFVARVVGDGARLVCFDRTREYESSAVHLAVNTGALVVQRLGRGWVRLSTPEGVATWDGIQWSTKPLSIDLASRIAPHAPDADPDGADQHRRAVHALAGRRARRGHARVEPHRRPPRAVARRHGGGRRDPPPRPLPPGPLRRPPQRPVAVRPGRAGRPRRHRLDRRRAAALVGAVPDAGPFLGTRHTSALRFTADEPSTLVFVVSSNGPLSVFCRGERLDLS